MHTYVCARAHAHVCVYESKLKDTVAMQDPFSEQSFWGFSGSSFYCVGLRLWESLEQQRMTDIPQISSPDRHEFVQDKSCPQESVN